LYTELGAAGGAGGALYTELGAAGGAGGALYTELGAAGGAAGGALYAEVGAAGGGPAGFWIWPSPICWTGTAVDCHARAGLQMAARLKTTVEARISRDICVLGDFV